VSGVEAAQNGGAGPLLPSREVRFVILTAPGTSHTHAHRLSLSLTHTHGCTLCQHTHTP